MSMVAPRASLISGAIAPRLFEVPDSDGYSPGSWKLVKWTDAVLPFPREQLLDLPQQNTSWQVGLRKLEPEQAGDERLLRHHRGHGLPDQPGSHGAAERLPRLWGISHGAAERLRGVPHRHG